MNIVLIAASFLGSFFILLNTTYASIAPYRDSGDLVVSSFTLGIAHPPGYALYVILGKIFATVIPFGDAAYRVQMFSAVSAALCGVLVIMILLELYKAAYPEPKNISEDIFVRVVFLFAAYGGVFSMASWSLAQVAEMYTQQAMLSLFIIWLLVKIYLQSDKELRLDLLALAGLMLALSMSMHQTVILILPGFALIILHIIKKQPSFLSNKQIYSYLPAVFLVACAGLLLFAFYPIRSFTEPVADWGNPQSFRNFIRLISRADYGVLKLHPEQSALISSFANLKEQVVFFSVNMFKQMSAVYFIFAAVGLFFLRSKLKLALFFVLLFFFSGPFFSLIANLPPAERTSYPILETNLALPNMLVALLAGAGFAYFFKFRLFVKIAVLAVLTAGFTMQFSNLRAAFDRRDNFIAYDYGKNVFKSVEKSGCLYNTDDSTTFISQYFSLVINHRTDVRKIIFFRTFWGAERLIKLYPEIMPSSNMGNAAAFLGEFFRKNIDVTPIYCDLPGKVPAGFDYYPKGSLYRLYREAPASKEERKPLEQAWEFYALRFDPYRASHRDFFNSQILSYYMSGRNNLGLKYSAKGNYVNALANYNRALSYNLDFYETYNNIGILYYYKKDFESALRYYSSGLRHKPAEPSLFYNIGLAYRELNDYNKALEYLMQIKTPSAYNEIGYIFLNLGELDAAELNFIEAIKLNPSYELAYYNLGLVYEKKSQYMLAEKYYKIYHDSVSDPAEKNHAHLKLEEIRRKN